MLTIREIPGGSVLERGGAFVAINSQAMRYAFGRIFEGWHGDIATTGLGLGVAAQMLADMPDVESVTVIECDESLVRLINLEHPKIHVVTADAWYWLPDTWFDFAFHDIWSEFPSDGGEESRLMNLWEPFVGHQACLPLEYRKVLSA